MSDPMVALPTETQCRDAAWEGFGFLTVAADGEIINATEKAELLFGYKVRNSLIGRSVDELVPQNIRSKHPGLRQSYTANSSQRPMNGGRVVQGCKNDGTTVKVLIILSSKYINRHLYTTAMVAEVLET